MPSNLSEGTGRGREIKKVGMVTVKRCGEGRSDLHCFLFHPLAFVKLTVFAVPPFFPLLLVYTKCLVILSYLLRTLTHGLPFSCQLQIQPAHGWLQGSVSMIYLISTGLLILWWSQHWYFQILPVLATYFTVTLWNCLASGVFNPHTSFSDIVSVPSFLLSYYYYPLIETFDLMVHLVSSNFLLIPPFPF